MLCMSSPLCDSRRRRRLRSRGVRMQRVSTVVFSVLLLAAGAPALAQPVAMKAGEIKWSDMKGMPGWKQAILVGDPDKPGPYVERIKVPPNASVPPHSHPDTENITV